jgi:hypothetical protein
MIREISAELGDGETVILSLDGQSAKIPLMDGIKLLAKFGEQNSILQVRVMDILAENKDTSTLQECLSKMTLGLNAGPFNTSLTTSEMTRLILSIQVKLFSIIKPEGWVSSFGKNVLKPLIDGVSGMVEVENIRTMAEGKMGIEIISQKEMKIINQLYAELQEIVTTLDNKSLNSVQ